MDLIRQRDFGIQQIVPQLTPTADDGAAGVGGCRLPVGPLDWGVQKTLRKSVVLETCSGGSMGQPVFSYII